MFNDVDGTFMGTPLAKIDTWNFGVNDVNDAFEIKRDTEVVIAPGSDMPYCLVHWVDGQPGAGDGWPAQAANPAAYVDLLDTEQDDYHTDWHPILLSHKPMKLKKGWYVPALPMMAFYYMQWDYDHAYPTTLFEYPEVILAESKYAVEMNPYCFTTKEVVQTNTQYWHPWYLNPNGNGNVSSETNLVWSKKMGMGIGNETGSSMTGTCAIRIRTKCRTWPDTAGARTRQSYEVSGLVTNGSDFNIAFGRFSVFKLSGFVCDQGTILAGMGIIIY